MTEYERLENIRAWRARMVVVDPLYSREDAATDLDEDGKVAVFQHTVDDYDFMLGMIDEYGLGR